jgi:hypothetical protein
MFILFDARRSVLSLCDSRSELKLTFPRSFGHLGYTVTCTNDDVTRSGYVLDWLLFSARYASYWDEYWQIGHADACSMLTGQLDYVRRLNVPSGTIMRASIHIAELSPTSELKLARRQLGPRREPYSGN